MFVTEFKASNISVEYEFQTPLPVIKGNNTLILVCKQF